MSEVSAIHVGVALLGGILLGGGYFTLLYQSVRLHETGAAPWAVVMLHVARAGLAVAAFWGLAQLGAWPLIAGLVGFLGARLIAQRLVGRS